MARTNTPDHRKPCTLCQNPRDVLIRCQIDETGRWHFVCPGSCWKHVSGGEIDGDGAEKHQWYRYGGMWKNKHEAVSAKKPKKRKPNKTMLSTECESLEPHISEDSSLRLHNWNGDERKYTKNDKVSWGGSTWTCRKSHFSQDTKTPGHSYQLWKEEKAPS